MVKGINFCSKHSASAPVGFIGVGVLDPVFIWSGKTSIWVFKINASTSLLWRIEFLDRAVIGFAVIDERNSKNHTWVLSKVPQHRRASKTISLVQWKPTFLFVYLLQLLRILSVHGSMTPTVFKCLEMINSDIWWSDAILLSFLSKTFGICYYILIL